jgi:hypothetical protein
LITKDGGYPFKGQKDLSPAFKTTFNSYILSLFFPSMIAESAARRGIGPNQVDISGKRWRLPMCLRNYIAPMFSKACVTVFFMIILSEQLHELTNP